MQPGWQLFGLTISDLIVISLMVLVFVLAVTVQSPRKRRERLR